MRPDHAAGPAVSLSTEQRAALQQAVTEARRWLRGHHRKRKERSANPTATRAGVGQAAGPPSVLFAGAGREAARVVAQQLAGELGRDLYRVNLRIVVSKYIGETEKNLERVLETSERTGAVLLLDEADALFGRRSDVGDSHDRYANLEIDYLLQRLASFHGLGILACRKSLGDLGGEAGRFHTVIELCHPSQRS